MGIQRSRDDSWTKEMAKWEHRPVLVGDTYIEPIPFAQGGKGGAPHVEYPKALYKAELADGGYRILPHKLVHDEGQERVALGQGWSLTQNDAIEMEQAHQHELAELAANRAFNDRRMSEKARAEAAAADESTMAHLPEIPEARRNPSRAATAAKG